MKRKIVIIFLSIIFIVCFVVGCGKTNNLTIMFMVDNEIYTNMSTTGLETIIFPTAPEKEGYVFDGWYLDNGTWQKPFTENTLLDTPIENNLNVYAKFNACKYAITYNANGGTVSKTSDSVAYDSYITLPTPTRTGYGFDGWYNGSTKINSGTWKTANNVTLIAKWKISNYLIAYNLNGGINNSQNPSTYTINDTVILKNPTKTGYTFIGWTYSGQKTPTTSVVIPQGSTEEKKYTANWSVNTYAITYNANGGTVSKTSDSVAYDSYITLPTPTRTGYGFDGWYNGSTKINSGTWKTANNVTLIAKWSIINYTITYNLNGGVNNSLNPSTYTINDLPLTLHEATHPSLIFTGWYKESSFTNKVAQIEQVGNITLYAKNVDYTQGLVFTLNNSSYYSVSDCTGTDFEVFIPKTYNGKPVTSIGARAFSYCRSLTSVTIPDSVTSIGYDAFSYCISLTKVNYLGTIDEWVQIEFGNSSANPLYHAENLYINDQLVTQVQITFATSINAYAFNYYSNLKRATIGDSVKSIGGWAFFECSGLEKITLPHVGNTLNGTKNTHFGYIFGASDFSSNISYVPINLKEVEITGGLISERAFYNCANLTNIEILENVTSIGDSAFYSCSSLTSLTIGNSVTSIGYNAFSGCNVLTSYYEYDNGSYLGNSQNNYVVLVKPKDTSIVACKINDKCKFIYNGAFSNCSSLKNVTVGSGVTSIGSSAFSNCSSLTSITIPNSVTSIGSSAFFACKSIRSATFGKNSQLTSIGNYVFKACSSLTSIEIPKSVTSIGEEAFRGCSSLTSIEIPESVTSIASYAFYYCKNLTKITLPFVGESATASSGYDQVFGYIFGYTTSSSTTVFDATYQYNVGSTYYYYYIPTSLKEVVITGGSPIGMYAFNSCSNLISVTIGNSVTSIGDWAFYKCSGLKSVTILDSVTSIGDYAFKDCSNIEKATIPCIAISYIPKTSLKEVVINGGTSIGGSAFAGCSGLTNITIPNSVTSIGSSAFKDCSGLESITIPNSVTSIGSFAFNNCSGLKSVTIPNSVTSIGDSAFKNCSGLTSVTFENPNGWWRSYSSTATSGTAISSTDLSNTSTAATYLKSNYCYYYWKRS